MNRICSHCASTFSILPEDLTFLKKLSPTIGNRTFDLPPPTHCPECRQQRRLTLRNERYLYKSTCSFSGKTIVSAYSPDKNRPVYENAIWWSDKWNPLKYGQSFDPEKPFFEQMKNLLDATPLMSLSNATSENCEYTHNATYNKNCYMLFCGSFDEDCLHSYWIQNSSDCIDCIGLRKCERCYECLDSLRCYDLLWSQDCVNCTSGAFLWDCMGCANCVGCTNLRNKTYCWLNEQLSKEEFETRYKALRKSERAMQVLRKQLETLKGKAIHPWSNQRMNENCLGNYIVESRNCQSCFDARQSENCSYCEHIADVKDSMDVSFFGLPGELLYECNNLGVGAYNCLFSSWGYGLKNSLYCFNCHFCDSCLGCVSLHNKKHCIFNVQYSEEEYAKLAEKILTHMQSTGEWGEFFPASMSPFGYNETVAQEYFPLTREEVQNLGWHWSTYELPAPHADRVIRGSELPASIDDIPDDVTNWAIECATTGKPFRIVHQELAFYRKMQLPVPRLHPDERHRLRMALRNPRRLWNRQCAKCKESIMTSYAPERPETVYCEKCFLASVY